LAPGDLPKAQFIIGTENQWIGFSATHGGNTPEQAGLFLPPYWPPEFRASFVSGDT